MKLFQAVINLLLGKQKVIGVFEEVTIYGANGSTKKIPVKIDTGAYRSSIDKNLAKELDLHGKENHIDEVDVKSALGVNTRPVVELEFELAGIRVQADASIADRSRLRKPMIVGRKDLTKFLVTSEAKKTPVR
jgi:hypothetical protein